MSSATLLRLRRPAVSMNTSRRPSYANGVSIASRVVPGSSATTSRSRPSKRLTRLDFPTLGRPTTATWIASSSSWAPGAGSPGPEAARRHERAALAVPLGPGEVAGARAAGAHVRDGLAPADDAVEQRGLTDVGPADDGHRGQAHHTGTPCCASASAKS